MQVSSVPSKLDGIQVGEFVGTDLTKFKYDNVEHHERIMENIRCGIGKAISVTSPEGKLFVAVLEDIDFISNPTEKRFIFTYNNPVTNSDETIDTLYDKGWTVNLC